MDPLNYKEINPQVLAYLGDSVWELEVRQYWILKKLNIHNLNKNVKKYVSAKVQSKYFKMLYQEFDTNSVETLEHTKIRAPEIMNTEIKDTEIKDTEIKDTKVKDTKTKEDINKNYQLLMKRTKNTNIKTFPRSCSKLEYREATAFEALIGVLYLEGKEQEIKIIVKKCIEGV